MKTLITLRNDFHQTSVNFRLDVDFIGNDLLALATLSQSKKIRRKLCGMKDCTCGGVRGPQTHNEKRVRFEVVPEAF